MMKTIKQYNKRLEALKSERSSFTDQWAELAEYCMSYRARFLIDSNNKGDNSRVSKTQLNNHARRALRTISAGMQAGITSPSRPWFKLEAAGELNEDQAVKQWIKRAQDLMYEIFAGSNLYNSLHTLYSELACFGTAAIGAFDDFDDVVHFKTFSIGSYYFTTDDEGGLTAFYREYRNTTGQLVEKFGLENCSRAVKQQYEKGDLDSWHRCVHAIEKNLEPKDTGMSKDKPVKSVYYEYGVRGEDKFLRESGYDEFPVAVARWDLASDDIYATDSPGMIALGDIKALQLGEKRKYQAIDKIVNPPMIGDATLKQIGGSKILLPDNITWASEQTAGMRSIYESYRPDINAIVMVNQEAENRISKAFYEDLFLMLSNSDRRQITATEIAEKQEEKLLQLGPVLERLHSELLDPLIDRVFAIVLRSGILPTPPEALQGDELQVKYVSILAQAQRMSSIGAVDRMANFAANISQVYPEAAMKINALELIDEYADNLGVNPSMIRSNKEVQDMMQAQQEAAQQQQAMQSAQAMANTAKTAGEINPENIGSLMQQMGM